METQTFAIKGMHCASCVSVIERTLKKTNGILTANVNIATETATVKFNPQFISNEIISSIVAGVGYKALAVEEDEEKEAALLVGDLRVVYNRNSDSILGRVYVLQSCNSSVKA